MEFTIIILLISENEVEYAHVANIVSHTCRLTPKISYNVFDLTCHGKN